MECPSCSFANPAGFKFCGSCAAPLDSTLARPGLAPPPERDPRSYTPKHLADRILQSRFAPEGERKRASDGGHPEQALCAVQFESELHYALRIADGTRTLSQAAARLAENSIPTSQVGAARPLCEELASAREWNPLLEVASETVRLIRERSSRSASRKPRSRRRSTNSPLCSSGWR